MVFLQPNRKYPTAAPTTTAAHSHELYVMKMSMRRYASVTCMDYAYNDDSFLT